MSRTSAQAASGLLLGLLLASLPLVGCSDGADGVSTGVLNGTVTNGANSAAPVAGATITTTPVVQGVTITTDANGAYTATLPAGVYQLEVAATNFTAVDSGASILAAVTTTMDYTLTPVSDVVVDITGAPEHSTPGESFQLTAAATPMDGSTVSGYSWAQTNSAPATIADGTSATPTITLGDTAAYKAALLEHVPVLPDRFVIVGIDPHSYELAGLVTFECQVTTSSGTYPSTVDVHTTLDFAAWTTSLRNVPIGQAILLSGKVQATFDWALNTPGGATATLTDATTRFPYFTPDIKGNYTVTVTDIDAAATVTLEIYAGEWWGGINGMDSEGNPTTTCASACHAGIYNDKFVDWAATGHAEIFTNNINTGGHYSDGCFDCHTVGFGSGGIDSTTGYDEFYAAMFPDGQSIPDPGNWAKVLADYPAQAAFCNIQCDNCHGPSGDGSAHANPTATSARMGAASQVCAICHGEPPRHARYQQWLESGHGNFELAIEEGERGSCGKCHTGQGFVEWSKMAIPFDVDTNPVNLGPGVAEPITCMVCHDPHNVGTRSGNDNDVTMRWDDTDSPPLLAGFTAYQIGKGSICIICHNTRRGEAESVITTTPDRAPHGGAQGDMLMSQNAFYVPTGIREAHSLIVDTCANCHVARTPPPADLSYNLSGTNHTFEASTSICADCHGGFDPASLIAGADRRLEDFESQLEASIENEIAWHVGAGRTVQVDGEDANGDPATATINSMTSIVRVTHFGSSHGRQAMDISVDGTDVLHVQMDGDTTVFDMTTDVGSLWDNTEPGNGGDVLRRVGWNFNLLLADGSHSLHNPGWWQQIINASEMELGTIRP